MRQNEINQLLAQFVQSKDVLMALGDETRLHIVMEMLKVASNNTHCEGMRVGEIAKVTALSRPAMSHHIKILKDSGLIQCRKEGRMNFYFLDPDDAKLREVIACLSHALAINEKERKHHGHA
jgi:ArsR family transcriptional regulator, arsenate/arsenite/antimonite-responsive transcriptional repressor